MQVIGIEKGIFVIICNNQKYIFGRISSDEAKEKWEDLKDYVESGEVSIKGLEKFESLPWSWSLRRSFWLW